MHSHVKIACLYVILTGGFSVDVRLSDPFQKLHFGVKMKAMEVGKKTLTYIFRHMSCKQIQRGWESGKGQETCSEEQPHNPAAVWPGGAQAPALRQDTGTEQGSMDPLTPCHCCPTAAGCPGGKAVWAQGRVDIPPHPDPNCPAILFFCMHHGGETALISWLAGSALAVGCAGQEQPFFTS